MDYSRGPIWPALFLSECVVPVIQLNGESLIWALSALAQLNRTPFDPKLVLQQFAPPYSVHTLHEAATSLGLKVGFKQVQARELSQLSLPCLAVLEPLALAQVAIPEALTINDPKVIPIAAARAAEKSSAATPSAHGIALIVQADADNVSFFDGASENVNTLALSEFAQRFSGQVLLFVRQPTLPAEDQGEAPRAKEFGFSWFIPELLKHKHIWRDVLAASLVIQLMALATPLFTQVVIDKVVVHQTLNTLVVIGIALGVFMLFTAVMTWVRQYLVLHTGNRVDAVLGSQVFDHLLKLPLRYHQHRPTGVVVARIHGVETIRQFVSSAAVT
jgi:subfamily B ATP-binding cassette protein HlyB/CyaB